jgi:hypothetical protein
MPNLPSSSFEPRALLSVLSLVAVACGGPPATTGGVSVSGTAVVASPAAVGTSGGTSVAGPAASPGSAAAGGAGASAAPSAPAPPPPPEHPFASNASEATSLIDAAVDARAPLLLPCITAARAHRKNPHEKIQIEVGLDETGHLMGIKAPKGAPSDPELFACAQKALTGANFPTSHAGIITVTKTFEDQAVYR